MVGMTISGSEHCGEGSATMKGEVPGVDTHLDFHMAVVLDLLGRRLG